MLMEVMVGGAYGGAIVKGLRCDRRLVIVCLLTLLVLSDSTFNNIITYIRAVRFRVDCGQNNTV